MKIGVALSGGGIRGIAHAGVLKALEDNNIKIDIIGGTSSGSLVAALFAMGYSPYYIYILFKRYAKDMVSVDPAPIAQGVRDFVLNKKLGLTGFNSGDNIEIEYNNLALRKGVKKIADVKIPLVITSVDIKKAKEYIFTNNIPNRKSKDIEYIDNISIGKAVRASSSFPGIFCPCEYENNSFLDGGILDNIPVLEVKKQGADKVLAVNFKADDIDKESNLMDIIMRTLDIMGNKISEDCLRKSDFVLTVETDKTGLLDVSKLDECYKYGYDSVIKNIDKIKKILT